jgi:hypothetical protein
MQDGTVGQGLAEVTPVIGAMRASANTARAQGNTAWAEQLETWAYQIERNCAAGYRRPSTYYSTRYPFDFVIPPYYSYFHPIDAFFFPTQRTLTQLGPAASTTVATATLTPGGGVVVR